MSAPHEVGPLPAADTVLDLTAGEYEAELTYFITRRIHHAPRSLQKALGPSEIGIECARRLAYKIADVPEVNEGDGWLATIGTATHAWLADTFTAANAMLGQERFLLEQRVTVGSYAGEPVVGSTDLYDRVTRRVLDFKVMGKTTLTALRRKGPSAQYRKQGHAYGRGWVAAGHPVERVAVWGLPRNSTLSDSHLWEEPYDETVAVAALDRLDGIATLVGSLGAGAAAVLPTADSYCSYCPWYRHGASVLTESCPGHPGSRVNTGRPTATESLIA